MLNPESGLLFAYTGPYNRQFPQPRGEFYGTLFGF